MAQERHARWQVTGRDRDAGERIREAAHPAALGEVDSLAHEPGLQEVRVRVDERRCDERAVEIDHVIDGVRQSARGVVRAEPGDDAVRHEHSLGGRVGR